MRIGEYSVIRKTEKGYLVSRDGMLYRLVRCPQAMTQERADAMTAALERIVCPGSNILAPTFLCSERVWYSAVPYKDGIYGGLPHDYLRCLPEDARRHMILLAVSAMEVLARGGVVHGSLSPDCFGMMVTGSGVLCLVLEDLRKAGFGSREPLEPDRRSSYAAPELHKGGAPTAASDVFSLGLCLHSWLAGELPRCKDSGSDALTKDDVLLSAAVPQWARGVVSDMLHPDAASRPTAAEAFARLAKGDETIDVPVYICESDTEEDADICNLMLEEDPRLVERYG